MRNKELEILKVSGSDYGTKREISIANKNEYSISTIYHLLDVSRSIYYYKVVESVS